MVLPARRQLLAGLALLPAWRCGAAQPAPCCGPITPNGARLAQLLDGIGVDRLWVSGWHIDWRSGEKNRPEPGGPNSHTHCSAFAAAVAERLGVYILRPPQHPQQLLANAQMAWLAQQGGGQGWRPVRGEAAAQALANRGVLVVASYENPDPHKPGHIAIVRPSDKSAGELQSDGPQITQAGGHNYLSTTLANGFRKRRPQVAFFAHDINWSTGQLRS